MLICYGYPEIRAHQGASDEHARAILERDFLELYLDSLFLIVPRELSAESLANLCHSTCTLAECFTNTSIVQETKCTIFHCTSERHRSLSGHFPQEFEFTLYHTAHIQTILMHYYIRCLWYKLGLHKTLPPHAPPRAWAPRRRGLVRQTALCWHTRCTTCAADTAQTPLAYW